MNSFALTKPLQCGNHFTRVLQGLVSCDSRDDGLKTILDHTPQEWVKKELIRDLSAMVVRII